MTGKSKPTTVSIRSVVSVLLKRLVVAATRIIVSILFLLVAAGSVRAAIDATVTISSQDAGGGVFNYTLTLNNLPTSTSSIETLWYSWIPGLDFMSVAPSSTTAPTGWAGSVQHTGSIDGYSVQFTTTTAPLDPNTTIQFGFSSTVTPAELAGYSQVPYYPFYYYLEDTTFLYSLSVESGDSQELIAETVPEPSTLALVAFGIVAGTIGIACRRLRPRIQK